MSIAEIPKTRAAVLPLEPGDRLNRVEFERRYHAMPNCKKAELIEGVVYMPSPARLRHGQPHAFLMGWILQYSIATPGTSCTDNTTNRLDQENEPQPDVAMFLDSACGGQTHISEDGYLTGRWNLLRKFPSRASRLDRGPKLRTYERHGVREYLIWRVDDKRLEWYVLRDNGFELQPLPDDGIYRSELFPGLWLNVPAMLQLNGSDVMTTLNEGLALQEHQNFVALLERKRKS